MAYTFDKANADAPSRHKTQYFEMMGDRAIYHEGWIASTKVIRPPWVVAGPVNQDPLNNCTWELYDLTKDWTQNDDIAAAHPEKLKELQGLVLDGSEQVPGAAAGRLGGHAAGARRGRTSPPAAAEFVYTRPLDRHPAGRLAAAAEHLLHHHGRRRDSRRAAPRA